MNHGRYCLCRMCLRISFTNWQEIEDHAQRSRAHIEVATRRADAERERYERTNSELERAYLASDDAQTRTTVKP